MGFRGVGTRGRRERWFGRRGVVANITEPERKLEDLERRLKYKLERAREITSTSSLEEPLDKTQEELMN